MATRLAFPRFTRVGLFVLAAVSAELGVWAAFFPRSFYRHFPGGGHVWVAVDGAYNQHLVRDFGQANLAYAILFVVALVLAERHVVWAALVAYVPAAVLHLIYHLSHLDVYRSTTDQVGNVVSLGLLVVIPLAVLTADLLTARYR